MRLLQELTFDDVVAEWLTAESYKIPDNPTLDGLRNMRPTMIKPLERIPVSWNLCEIETESDLLDLRIIRSGDWYECTGGSFAVTGIAKNLYRHPEHNDDILTKKRSLESKNTFGGKIILFGSDLENLTTIEGNHRLAAYALYGQEHGYDFLPIQAIVGLSKDSDKYYWCWDCNPNITPDGILYE